MITCPKLEDAVTGQLLSDDFDVLPSVGEGVKFLHGFQRNSMGPDKPQGYPRPKWNGQIFSERRHGAKSGISQLLDCEDLKGKIPERAGAYVHQKTIASGGFSLMVDGFDVASRSVANVGAHPHLNKLRDQLMFSKSVTKPSREKRISASICVVKNNSGFESKKCN